MTTLDRPPFRYPWRAVLIAVASLPALLLMLTAPRWAEKALADDFVYLGIWVGVVILAPLGLHFGGERLRDVLRPLLRHAARWAWLPALLVMMVLGGPGFLGRRWLNLDPNDYLVIVIFAWIGPTLFTIYWRNADALGFWRERAEHRPLMLRIALIIVALIPALVVLSIIWTRAINVPVSDDWRRLTLYYHDALPKGQIGEFWRAKNGVNRNFIPSIIAVASYYLTRANQLPIVYLGWATTIGNTALMTLIYNRLAGKPRWFVVLVPISVVLFSLSLRQVWIQGVLFHAHLMLLCLIGAIAVIMLAPLGPLPVVLAAVLTFIASTSAAEGNFAWLVLLPCLWAAGYRHKGTYIAWGTLTAILYAITLNEALTFARLDMSEEVQTNLGAMLWYAATYLGQPIMGNIATAEAASAVAGIVGLVTFGGSVAVNARHGTEHLRAPMPWIALASFVTLTALLTSLGRSEEGAELITIGSRYIIRGNVFWVALMLLTLTTATVIPVENRTVYAQSILGFTGLVTALALSLILATSADISRSGYYRATSSELQAARECLIDGNLDELCIGPLEADQRIIGGIDILATWDVSFMEPQP